MPVSRKDMVEKDVTANPPETLAYSLARKIENDPGLARLVAAWPDLPGAVISGGKHPGPPIQEALLPDIFRYHVH